MASGPYLPIQRQLPSTPKAKVDAEPLRRADRPRRLLHPSLISPEPELAGRPAASRPPAAERLVAAAAPGLQRVLNEALAAGGWFEDGHQGEILKVASNPDSEQRLQAMQVLIAEETRLAMMIGVAVGWSLSGELGAVSHDNQED